MRNFGEIIKEINTTLDIMLFFEAFLNSALIFLACYLFFAIIDINAFYAIIPAVIFFAIFSFLKLRENKVLTVEMNYPELKEKLRTAADNLDMHNPVVDELHAELIKEVRHVETSKFFNEKKTYSKIMAAILLSFIVLFLVPVHFDAVEIILKAKNVTEKNFPVSFGGGSARFYESSLAPGVQGSTVISGELYGQRSIAVLGGEELLLQFKSASQDLNVRKENEVSKKEFTESYPSEVYVSSAASFEENIPKERQELVKNYFKNLAEG